MPILISKTYTECTPESAEVGEDSASGFVFESVAYTFKELVQELENFTSLSCWPAPKSPAELASVWAETESFVEDYATLTRREEALHLVRDQPNHARAAKYWAKALNAAGLIK